MLKEVGVAVAATAVAGAVTAGAFALLGLVFAGVPNAGWGFVGGVVLALFSFVRTGIADRRRDRRRTRD